MVNLATKSVSVPIPRMTQNLYRGFTDRKTSHTSPVSIRWTDSDRAFIDRQAGVLGISFSEFVRWSAYFMAIEINKLDTFEPDYLATERVPKKRKVDMSEYE